MPGNDDFRIREGVVDCWSQVQTLEGKTLRTLDRHKSFEVVVTDDSQVLLKLSTGKVRPVRREEIEGAFRELEREGEIDLKGIEARHSPRSTAYVATILAELEGVKYRVRPVRLFYHSEQAVTGKSQEDVQIVREHKGLRARSVNVLRLIAKGHTYEQILALHPELTYPDIFDAAREALEAAGESP